MGVEDIKADCRYHTFMSESEFGDLINKSSELLDLESIGEIYPLCKYDPSKKISNITPIFKDNKILCDGCENYDKFD